eukprot:753837-Hanusia_phi.AAC.4
MHPPRRPLANHLSLAESQEEDAVRFSLVVVPHLRFVRHVKPAAWSEPAHELDQAGDSLMQ